MPTLPIDERGNNLYYVDTGEPPEPKKTYTTLMIVHGTAFHGATFKRIVPLAESYNVRLVIVNRRDYPGSSPYSEGELSRLRTGDAKAHIDFARNRAGEFATFIRHYVEQNQIPQATEDQSAGGIVLLGWSAGNNFIIPILAHADSIDSETRLKIEPYLRSIAIFEIPQWGVGTTTPDYGNFVLLDESISVAERAVKFNKWVSGYYTHKSVTSRNVDDLQHLPEPDSPPGTIDMLSLEDGADIIWHPAVARHEIAARSAKPEVYLGRFRRAICEASYLKYFPNCRMDVIWCENSTWGNVNASWILEKMVEEADEQNLKRRQLRTTMIPGPNANHFIHWDNPKKAMEYFAKVISS